MRTVAVPCEHTELSPSCQLLRQLALTPAGDGSLTGRARGGRLGTRAFGGHLAAQSVLAAAATIPPERQPDSLHMYFLTPGDVDQPFDYHVTTLREGVSTSIRQVTASQGGTVRTTALLSFARVTPGPVRQDAVAVVAPPAPQQHEAKLAAMVSGLDYRYFDDVDGPSRLAWLRCAHDLGDDPLWHAVVLAFASDLGTGRVVDLPHQDEPGQRRSASLDHAIWFHQAGRADEWTQYRLHSPVYVENRGLAQGELVDAHGRLVASVAQRMAISRRV